MSRALPIPQADHRPVNFTARSRSRAIRSRNGAQVIDVNMDEGLSTRSRRW